MVTGAGNGNGNGGVVVGVVSADSCGQWWWVTGAGNDGVVVWW